MDCPSCYTCDPAKLQCVAASNYTDPNGECPMYCGVKTVCDAMQVCVYTERPSCLCNWLLGECIHKESEEAKMLSPMDDVTLSTILDGGYSDADIRMFLAILEREIEHKKRGEQPSLHDHHVEDGHSSDMRIVLAVNCILIVGIIFVFFYFRSFLITVHKQQPQDKRE